MYSQRYNEKTMRIETYNITTHQYAVYDEDRNEMFRTKQGEIVMRDRPDNLSGIDRVMHEFATIVNNHPDMGVRLVWLKSNSDPDYWAGIAVAAYTRGVIDRQKILDICLALKGAGAKSQHFNEFVQKLGSGEI